MKHVHAFKMMGRGTHFAPVPNSRRVPRPVYHLACACGQKAFTYQSRPYVHYTWSADPAGRCTEADHEAAQLRKSPLARARNP